MLIRRVLLRLTLAPILVLFTLPQPTIASKPVLFTPTEINAVQGFLTRPIRRPEPPDMTGNYLKYVQAKQACDASGGQLSGLSCILPPPPPPSTPQSFVTQPPGGSHEAQVYAQGLIDATQFNCLLPLWNRESGWNPYAVNASSGAYGIPQALGHGHVYDLGDYVAQVDWGLAYISASYGSSCNALYHENGYGWY